MSSRKLTKKDLIRGLVALDQMAKDEGVLIDLTMYGGAALALVYDLRDSTRDIDVAIHTQSQKARDFSAKIAEDNGWPEDWLNDGVKGFLSNQEELDQIEDFYTTTVGLSISVASPRYLLAMKCMAMRTADLDHPGDRDDIVNLIKLNSISSKDDLFDLISSFYPHSQISANILTVKYQQRLRLV